MIEAGETYFNPGTDDFMPITSGIYHSHVVGFDTRTFDSGSKVFNITLQLAEDVGKMKVNKMIGDGNGGWVNEVNDKTGKPVMVKASHLVGRKFKSVGIWLTPNPPEGDGWKNGKYKRFFENLGIEFPTVEGKIKLMEIEESDILGLPVLSKISEEQYERDGETKTTMKVFDVFPWSEGIKLDESELKDDLPF